jgi:hypothetical protein
MCAYLQKLQLDFVRPDIGSVVFRGSAMICPALFPSFWKVWNYGCVFRVRRLILFEYVFWVD